MKKIVFIFLIVIGFTAYSQKTYKVECTRVEAMVIWFTFGHIYYTVECTGVEAGRYGFWPDPVTADTIQVEIIDVNGKKVVVPGVIECKFDTTYYIYEELWSGKSFVGMYVYPRYKIKIDPTGFKGGVYFIRLNVFGTCKIGKLVIKS